MAGIQRLKVTSHTCSFPSKEVVTLSYYFDARAPRGTHFQHPYVTSTLPQSVNDFYRYYRPTACPFFLHANLLICSFLFANHRRLNDEAAVAKNLGAHVDLLKIRIRKSITNAIMAHLPHTEHQVSEDVF